MKYLLYIAICCLFITEVSFAQSFERRMSGPSSSSSSSSKGGGNGHAGLGLGVEVGKSIGLYFKVPIFLFNHVSFEPKFTMSENWGTFFMRSIGCDSDDNANNSGNNNSNSSNDKHGCSETTDIAFFQYTVTGSLRLYTGKREGVFIGAGMGMLWSNFRYVPTGSEQWVDVPFSFFEYGFRYNGLEIFAQIGKRNTTPTMKENRINDYDLVEAREMWEKSLYMNRFAIGVGGVF